MMRFVTKATPMQRKLHYVSKHNKLVQLVVQVYHMNVIYSLGGRDTHTHTNVADKSNFRHVPTKGRNAPGLKSGYNRVIADFFVKTKKDVQLLKILHVRKVTLDREKDGFILIVKS